MTPGGNGSRSSSTVRECCCVVLGFVSCVLSRDNRTLKPLRNRGSIWEEYFGEFYNVDTKEWFVVSMYGFNSGRSCYLWGESVS